MPRHFRDAHSSLLTATPTFKSERLGHHTHCERPYLARKLGDHRSGPSGGSPAHPTNHQRQMGPLQDLSDFVPTLVDGSPPILWPCFSTVSANR